jgi:hypothetical protein
VIDSDVDVVVSLPLVVYTDAGARMKVELEVTVCMYAITDKHFLHIN